MVRLHIATLLLGAGLLWPFRVLAADPCAAETPGNPPTSAAARIAAVACAEHRLWFTPFIDTDGRLASMTVTEAEALRLGDGTTPAWQRVADYWRGSGLLSRMAGKPGASECAAPGPDTFRSALCRAFLVDNPWSAVFVTWVLGRAGLQDFRGSPSHSDYLRDAHAHPGRSPYVLADPDALAPAMGDLLCYVRSRPHLLGHQGLMQFLAQRPGEGLAMHCDVVVAASPGGDGRLYLVGGNVLQGVTMRVLPLNRQGRLWALPRGTGDASGCRPGNPAACSFNRRDWAALLQLKPTAVATQSPLPGAQTACCVYCVVGGSVPRC